MADQENEDEAMEDGDEQADNKEDGTEGLTARQLFKLLRGEYSNTAALACDLLQEAGLQERLRIIAGVLKPLHDEYNFDFAMQAGGQAKMMTFSALRADFHYYICVAEILEHMQDPTWVDALDLCPPSDGNDGDINMEADAWSVALKGTQLCLRCCSPSASTWPPLAAGHKPFCASCSLTVLLLCTFPTPPAVLLPWSDCRRFPPRC